MSVFEIFLVSEYSEKAQTNKTPNIDTFHEKITIMENQSKKEKNLTIRMFWILFNYSTLVPDNKTFN